MPGSQLTIERALSHHRAGEIDRAVALYRHVLRTDPSNAQVLDYLAQALEIKCRYHEAIEPRRRALRCEPDNDLLRDHLANLFLTLGEPDQSVAVWSELCAGEDPDPSAVLGLVRQLARARREPAALDLARRTLERHPGDRALMLVSASLHERLGNDTLARDLIVRALGESPDELEAIAMLARMDARAGRLAEARERLEHAAAHEPGASCPRIHAELGLVLDRLKDYDGAFAAASRGQHLAFDALLQQEREKSGHERLAADALKLTAEAAGAWARPAPAAGEPAAPIFIVGFPRSGTTLIEQMLAAHPHLAVSDELPTLQSVRQRLYAEFRRGGSYPLDLGQFTPAQVAAARRWYLERAYRTVPGAQTPSGRKRLVDKQPLNTVDACFIRLIFPESPVVYVQRDPRDTTISVFMQGFSRAVPHLFSLDGTAALYDMFARAWRHYERVLGLKSLRLRYEDLVADPERESRRLIELIEEPWNDAVLNFHAPEHRRFVVTPSYSDVSRPVYKTSMGRWRRYERHLAPVLPRLEPWVAEGGYQPS